MNFIFFQTRGKGQWFSWRDSITPITTSNLNIRELIVPTIDTVRYSYLMDVCIRHERLYISVLHEMYGFNF